MVQKLSVIWMDGKLVPWDEARVHVLTHSLHYGLAAFEGIRSYETHDGRSAVFRLADHLRRLADSCHIGQMKLPYTLDELAAACKETLAANGLRAGYIRPVAYIGEGVMGVHPQDNPIRVFIATWSWGAYLGEEALKKGIRAKISSYTRFQPNTIMTRAKLTGNYATGILAKREAKALGFDEAIMLDTEGYCAEGSGENLFIVRDGRVKTAPLTCVLPGITRDTILRLAADEGIEVVEQRFSRDELYIADEAFFTGTAAEVTPIREVDGRTIGSGAPGPVTRRLQERFFDVVLGRHPKYAGWLDYYEVGPSARKSAAKARA
ncbi:MAG TPA: branched-chain amino acid transaminase [Planctomycetota bacterium]|nr:branched-chain amino acid transaminase [Planctomycetota bacterium]